MELLYEMSRIQKITNDDLSTSTPPPAISSNLRLTSTTACITDQFVCSLFDIIEEVSDDVTDPYHYPVIRVLVSSS